MITDFLSIVDCNRQDAVHAAKDIEGEPNSKERGINEEPKPTEEHAADERPKEEVTKDEEQTTSDATKETALEEAAKKFDALEKRFEENRKYASKAARKISEAKKTIEEAVSEGEIDESLSTKILEILKSDKLLDIKTSEPSHPMDKYRDMVNRDLYDLYVDSTDDSEAGEKISAFDALVSDSNEEELSEIIESLEKCKSPMSVLKKMIDYGKSFLDSGMKELHLAGGIRKFIEAKNAEIKKLQEKLDKLNKQVLDFKQVDKPVTKWLGGKTSTSRGVDEHSSNDILSEILADADRAHKARRG